MRTKLLPMPALLLAISLTATAQPQAGQSQGQGQGEGQAQAQGQGQQGQSQTPLVTGAGFRSGAPVPDNAPTVDIFALIDRLAREMNKEFILDPRMRGIVGFSTAGGEADYDTLLALLRANQYVAIEVGDEIRIVSEATARSEPSPVVNEDDNRISDHAVVTRVIDVSDLEFELQGGMTVEGGPQLVPVLRPLMSTAIGNITSIPGSPKIIIVDRYDNVRRITEIIDLLRR